MKKGLMQVMVPVLIPLGLVGCGSTLPLVFTDKTTLGIEASGGGEGAPEISLGFKTTSVAVVPVAVRRQGENGAVAEVVPLQAHAANGSTDAYSTFGNFTTDTSAGAATATVGLGRFFATGIAAQNIAAKVGEAMIRKADTTGQTPR